MCHDSSFSCNKDSSMNSLGEGVRILSETGKDGEWADVIACAYDAGLATAFYGKHSAIAEGSRRQLHQALVAGRAQGLDRPAIDFIRQVRRFGERQGGWCRDRADLEPVDRTGEP